ncbi:MAG: PEGA domain-containing protein [candidate division WOR-3 bacterium]
MLIALCLIFLFSGCATIIYGTKEKIYVQSEPSGAKIIVNQNKELGETPMSIIISKKTKEITLKKDNYKLYTVKLNPKINYDKACLTNFGVSGLSGCLFFSPIGQFVLTNDKLGPVAFLAWAGWVLIGGCIIGPIIDGATGAAYDFDLRSRNINIILEETDSVKFEVARKKNSIEGWEKFLESVPESSFYGAQAYKILDTLSFLQAKEINTVESYRKYLRRFPRGIFYSEAEAKLKQLSAQCFSPMPTDANLPNRYSSLELKGTIEKIRFFHAATFPPGSLIEGTFLPLPSLFGFRSNMPGVGVIIFLKEHPEKEFLGNLDWARELGLIKFLPRSPDGNLGEFVPENCEGWKVKITCRWLGGQLPYPSDAYEILNFEILIK